MAYSYLVDISHWQGNVDHAKVAAAGISGCVIKASEGLKANTSAATIAHFAAHAPVIKRTYPLYGAFHYLQPGNTSAQVGWFLQQIKAGFGDLDGCVIQLDAEAVGKDSAGRSVPLLSVEDVAAWKREWDRATDGHPVLLYAPRWYWAQVTGYSHLASLGFAGWWPSSYVSPTGTVAQLAPLIQNGWQGWAGLTTAVLQFAQTGRVPGISGDVDLNEVRMPLEQFRALTTRSVVQEDEMSADFQAKAEAQLTRQGSQLDWIYDAVVGGRGEGWTKGALPATVVKAIADIAARDAIMLAAIKALAASQGIGDDGIQKIIEAVEGNREAAAQEAATAVTNALSKLIGAAVNAQPAST